MSNKRLSGIPGFSIDRVAAAAGSDAEVLRLENLDTDLPPPPEALEATRNAIGADDANSYLPFTGRLDLREVVTEHIQRLSGHRYDPATEVVITCGGTEGMFDTLLAVTDPGDEVVLTDPTYAGMTNRVRLAGAAPKLVPFRIVGDRWRLDLDALRSAINDQTRVLFLMNPSMPSGGVLTHGDWKVIVELCLSRSLWLVYNAAMERILFDGLPHNHPAGFPDMADRTITVGSVSKEYRMIGWRIGWVAGPASIMEDIAKVHIYNVVTPTGIAQAGALAALNSSQANFHACVTEWERRRNTVLEQLSGLPVVACSGGWSLLLNVRELGHDSFTASKLLLGKGKVAATPMRDWGRQNGDQFVRLVYSNEPVSRLSQLRTRVTHALL